MISLEELMSIAKNNKASDVHITVGVPPKMRVSGELIPMNFPILTPTDTKNILTRIMNQNQVKAYEDKGGVEFSYTLTDIGRCRVNIYRQRGAMTAAVRLISTSIPKPESLGLPESVLQLCYKKRGLILVTGPAGCGKTTTIASLIDEINENTNSHIITIEDPIEYLHQHKQSMVNQREIGMDTHSYAEAIRAALREDPDIIMLGEMMDDDTIRMAIAAARTGHLVLSSFYSGGLTDTIESIVYAFPQHQQQQVRMQLASVLEAVIIQQLQPKEDSGNRKAIFEVVQMNEKIRNLIRESKTDLI